MKYSVLVLPFLFVACTSDSNLAEPQLEAAMAASSSSSGNKLQCFSGTQDGGYNGTCTLTRNGADLNTIDADADPNNAYAGVYVANTNVGGKSLSDINRLAFDYNGSGAVGGSPRFSIPIDDNGDKATDGYLFIDTVNCNDGDPNVGRLDAINDATCVMYYNNVAYANWAAFAATGYRISGDIPFVIVDQPGTFSITNVEIGRGAAKSKP